MIDWNESPEGTNAYCSGYWLKRLDGDECLFLMQPVNNGWEPVNFKPWKQESFVYRDTDEERQTEIKQIRDDLDVPLAVAERAYDAGYRKQ